jgi:hypothetical protein
MRFTALSASIAAIVLGSCSLVPGSQAALEKEARQGLADTLFDAASARFSDLRVVPAPKNEEVLCGRVNAKNKIGAYIGFKRFLYVRKDGFAVVELGQEAKIPAPETEQEIADKAHQEAFEEVWEPCDANDATAKNA